MANIFKSVRKLVCKFANCVEVGLFLFSPLVYHICGRHSHGYHVTAFEQVCRLLAGIEQLLGRASSVIEAVAGVLLQRLLDLFNANSRNALAVRQRNDDILAVALSVAAEHSGNGGRVADGAVGIEDTVLGVASAADHKLEEIPADVIFLADLKHEIIRICSREASRFGIHEGLAVLCGNLACYLMLTLDVLILAVVVVDADNVAKTDRRLKA